jgi:hypothetical protein
VFSIFSSKNTIDTSLFSLFDIGTPPSFFGIIYFILHVSTHLYKFDLIKNRNTEKRIKSVEIERCQNKEALD